MNIFRGEHARQNTYGIAEWKSDEPALSKKNFISFMVKSFEISQGFPFIHKMFCVWVIAHDPSGKSNVVEECVRDFFDAGGWDTLFPAQQSKFINIFSAIPDHVLVLQKFLENPNQSLEGQFERMDRLDLSDVYKELGVSSIEGLQKMSFSGLMAKIKPKYHKKASKDIVV